MKRLASIVLASTIGLAVPVTFVACDSGEQPTRIPRSRLKPSVAWEDLTPERQAARQAEREQQIKENLVWPEETGPPRDSVVDYQSCQTDLASNRTASKANALVQLVWIGRCLSDKGWLLKSQVEAQEG